MSKHRQHRIAAKFGKRLPAPGSVWITITPHLRQFIDALTGASEKFAHLSRFRQRAITDKEGSGIDSGVFDETNAWEAL